MQQTQFLTKRGTQLVMLAVDNPGRNRYNFLAAGRNSYFPDKISFLTDQKYFDAIIPVKYINRNKTW